jgi:hypothetical protein
VVSLAGSIHRKEYPGSDGPTPFMPRPLQLAESRNLRGATAEPTPVICVDTSSQADRMLARAMRIAASLGLSAARGRVCRPVVANDGGRSGCWPASRGVLQACPFALSKPRHLGAVMEAELRMVLQRVRPATAR